MSYQVLARKWRPRNFSEVVGQEHVLRALINALDNNRLHHAYLFTGTRGVGKTTLGRILAKSLNCEQGVTSTPCGQCTNCVEIDEGRFLDLLEVDAASRTKVEDTRELLENVQYAPTHGRYKVYLIDEVHMLSNHSFNALLKTLEEPPPHVKFLLATTDPQKLPVTILSRCLKFNLKFIPVDRIQAHLAYVLGQENIPFEAAALSQIAKSAAGSMRDALSLLDQAIAHGSGNVREDEVLTMLGTLNREEVVGLLRALADKDGAKLLEEVNRLAQFGVEFSTVLSEVISMLHQLALTQIVGNSEAENAELEELSHSLSPEDVQLFYQIAIQGLKDLTMVPDSRAGFDMIMLRMLAFQPAANAVTNTVENKAGKSSPPDDSGETETPDIDKRQSARADLKAVLGNKPVSSRPMNEAMAPEAKKIITDEPSNTMSNLKAAIKHETKAQAPVELKPEPEPIPQEYLIAESMVHSDEPDDEVDMEAPSVVVEERSAAKTDKANKPQSWAEVVARLSLNGIARQVAVNTVVSRREGNMIYLTINPSFAQMANKTTIERIEQALSDFYQRPLKIAIVEGQADEETPAQQVERETEERKQDAVKRFAQDPAVQVMKHTFDAELDPNSVRLTD